MPATQPEVKILDSIIEIEQEQHEEHQVKVKGYHSAFVVHFIFKIVPLVLLAASQVTDMLFQERYNIQLIILFIVFEFWFTKNITGKRMLGIRWFFGEDQYGIERLKFECRANPEHIDFIKPKLFWIIQFSYCIIPVLFILEAIFLIPNTGTVNFTKIGLNILVITSGLSNGFYFLRLTNCMQEQQQILKTRLGSEGVRRLGLASITSYY